ncbi:MAG: hypothetical protein WA130_11635 [Candidatus Methanoperedens sp.]
MVNFILPMWIIQKIVLFAIFFLSGVSAYSLLPVRSSAAKYFSGILYAINPFVYIRFIAGQWNILLAYSVMPFAIKAFIEYLENDNRRNFLKLMFWTTLVAVFSIHMLILIFIVFFVILLFKLRSAEFRKSHTVYRPLILFLRSCK